MVGKYVVGACVLTVGVVQPTLQEPQVSDLTDVPGQALRIVRAGAFRRHLHQTDGAVDVALQLARVRRACVGRRIGPEAVHFVERVERLLVSPELQQRIAADPTTTSKCVHCNLCMPTIYSHTRCPIRTGEVPDPLAVPSPAT